MSEREPEPRSAFPDSDAQLSDWDNDEDDSYTVVDEPVREGLDNAVENSQVRTDRD